MPQRGTLFFTCAFSLISWVHPCFGQDTLAHEPIYQLSMPGNIDHGSCKVLEITQRVTKPFRIQAELCDQARGAQLRIFCDPYKQAQCEHLPAWNYFKVDWRDPEWSADVHSAAWNLRETCLLVSTGGNGSQGAIFALNLNSRLAHQIVVPTKVVRLDSKYYYFRITDVESASSGKLNYELYSRTAEGNIHLIEAGQTSIASCGSVSESNPKVPEVPGEPRQPKELLEALTGFAEFGNLSDIKSVQKVLNIELIDDPDHVSRSSDRIISHESWYALARAAPEFPFGDQSFLYWLKPLESVGDMRIELEFELDVNRVCITQKNLGEWLAGYETGGATDGARRPLQEVFPNNKTSITFFSSSVSTCTGTIFLQQVRHLDL